MFKVVIDTNLLINGSADDFNFGNRIIDLVLEGKLLAYANRATLAENCLMAAKKVADGAYQKKLDRYFEKVKVAEEPIEHLAVVEDRDDNKLIESAVMAEADFVVSSDRHLLKLGQYDGIRVVGPQQFWAIYEEEKGLGWQDWIRQFIQ